MSLNKESALSRYGTHVTTSGPHFEVTSNGFSKLKVKAFSRRTKTELQSQLYRHLLVYDSNNILRMVNGFYGNILLFKIEMLAEVFLVEMRFYLKISYFSTRTRPHKP